MSNKFDVAVLLLTAIALFSVMLAMFYFIENKKSKPQPSAQPLTCVVELHPNARETHVYEGKVK